MSVDAGPDPAVVRAADELPDTALGGLSTVESPASEFARVRSRGRLRGVLLLVGPAFVAAVAYIDPGNFATNFTAGARYGYTLLWVVVVADLVAMLVQYEAAKVGVASGRDLPELCRDTFPRTVSIGLWLQAEVVAMATDVAEFVGAAVGLYLVFGVPLFPAGIITAVLAFGILALEQRGHRRFELVIVALLGFVLLGFAYDVIVTGVDVRSAGGGLVPHFAGPDSVVLAAGIVGATVMPHVVYLHSALTKKRVTCRDDGERRRLLRFQRLDVVLALGVAGVLNIAMIVVAASFLGTGSSGADSILRTHARLAGVAGGGAALAFAIALVASGLSSSSVGTYSGQVVMQGFVHRRVPLFLRRALTMAPAVTVLALGLPLTRTLVISQVLLSFGIPFALVPLVLVARRPDVMGSLANGRVSTLVLGCVAGAIALLNGYLLWTTFVH